MKEKLEIVPEEKMKEITESKISSEAPVPEVQTETLKNLRTTPRGPNITLGKNKEQIKYKKMRRRLEKSARRINRRKKK